MLKYLCRNFFIRIFIKLESTIIIFFICAHHGEICFAKRVRRLLFGLHVVLSFKCHFGASAAPSNFNYLQ